MSTFIATKPLSDLQLWQAVRRVILQGTLVVGVTVILWCWLVPVLACASGTSEAMSSEFSRTEVVRRFGWLGIAGWTCLSFVFIWSTATLFAGCLFLGRDRQLPIPLAVVAGCVLLHFVVATTLPNALIYVDLCLWVSAVLLIAGLVIVLFVLACRRQLIDWRHIAGSAAVFALVFQLLGVFQVWSMGGAVVIAGILVAGIPLAPLALSISRHR